MDDQFTEHEDASSQHDTSVGWANNRLLKSHSWDSDSSDDYNVKSIRKKKEEHEYKVAGVQLPLKINGKTTTAWIESGS